MQLFEIGYFSRTHGVKGQLVLRTIAGLDTGEIKAVFVDIAGSRVPYFVAEARETADSCIFSLEEVDSLEKAKTLLNKPVWVDKKFVLPDEDETQLIGYELLEEEFGSLGTITAMDDNGAQELIVLIHKGREIMLPLVDEFITGIDDAARVIRYKAPPGLISLYLEDDGGEDREPG